MVRAALDFATKSPYFHGFRNGSAITVDEMRKDAIQRFENREVESAIFSWLVPFETEGRNVFTIVFKKMEAKYADILEIEIKSVTALKDQSKKYKADATIYSESEIRNPKPQPGNSALDKAL